MLWPQLLLRLIRRFIDYKKSHTGRMGCLTASRIEDHDPRVVFTRELDPRCARERKPVRDRDRIYAVTPACNASSR
jgi:hypothetical protein